MIIWNLSSGTVKSAKSIKTFPVSGKFEQLQFGFVISKIGQTLLFSSALSGGYSGASGVAVVDKSTSTSKSQISKT